LGCDREFIFNVADFNSVGEMAVADVNNAGIYKNFARAQKHFSTAIMNRRTISQYSPELTKLIENVQNSPVYGMIGSWSDITANVSYDITRAYTHALMSIIDLPIFCKFDQLRLYQEYDFKPGVMIHIMKANGIQFEILYELVPSRTEPNTAKKAVQRLYNDESVDSSLKKEIVNSVTGMLIKKRNHSIQAFAFRLQRM